MNNITNNDLRPSLAELRAQMAKLCPEAVSNLDRLIELEDEKIQLDAKRRIEEKKNAEKIAKIVDELGQLERRRQLLKQQIAR